MESKIFVSNVIINENEQILLIKEKDEKAYGKYNLPGGLVEPPESILEAIKRETFEETYLHPIFIGIIGFYTLIKDIYAFHIVFKSFVENPKIKIDSNDIQSYHWLSKSKIITLPKDMVLNSAKLQNIIQKLEHKEIYPLDLIIDLR